MGFVERAFTLPGSTPPPPGSPANPLPTAPAAPAAAPTPAPVAPPPAPPTLPTAAPPPSQFIPGQAPGARQRASTGAATFLGAGAATGQTARKTLLGQ